MIDVQNTLEPPTRPNREATQVHTRILRCMLAVDDCYAYWRKVDGTPPASRATIAFEQRWFGTKSEARVRTLITEMAARFDPYPEAVALLASIGALPPGLLPWICHTHLQLADPIYRRFSGELLPGRRALGYTTIDRLEVASWIHEIYPERWAQATAMKFAANLIATGLEVGLLQGRRDPRTLSLGHVPGEAIGYAMYLLRGVEIEGPLVQSPYLRSLGVNADLLVGISLRVPGVRCASVGDLVDITWEEPSLGAWGQRYLRGLS